MNEPPPAEHGGPRWQRLLEAVRRKILGNSVVREVLAVMDAANSVGAPLFAAALAFSTMFTIVPLLLLFSGVLGWLIDNVQARASLLERLVSFVPPLADAIAESLEGIVNQRGALSLIGLALLVWAASNFYGSLDEVMRRLFPGGRVRGFVERRVRGVVAIVALVLLLIGSISLASLWQLIDPAIDDRIGPRVVGPFLSLVVMIVASLIVYRFVPTDPPGWRAALLPALAAGLGIGLLTLFFATLAPVLIGGLSGLGVVAAVFAAFVWLNYCYQMLLYGAAWARIRRDRARLADTGPGPGDAQAGS